MLGYKILHAMGCGYWGTTYLVRKDGKDYAMKIERILSKDVKKSKYSPVWRELDFSLNVANKTNRFMRLVEYKIIDNCKHKQKKPNYNNKEFVKHWSAIQSSPWCIVKILTPINYTLRHDFNALITPDHKKMYSMLAQLLHATYKIHKAGWIHGDIHQENVGCIYVPPNKHVSIFGYKIPTYRREFQLIDYGAALSKSYVNPKDQSDVDAIHYAYGYEAYFVMLLVNDQNALNHANSLGINPEEFYGDHLKHFRSTPQYKKLCKEYPLEYVAFHVWQILYPREFQMLLFGKKFKKVIKNEIFIPLKHYLACMRIINKPREVTIYMAKLCS
jgi:serine/threonine protein kinase